MIKTNQKDKNVRCLILFVIQVRKMFSQASPNFKSMSKIPFLKLVIGSAVSF